MDIELADFGSIYMFTSFEIFCYICNYKVLTIR